MKKIFLAFVLAICAGSLVAAPTEKKIKFSEYAYYEGMAEKKSPQGRGTLHPCSRCVVTGVFDNGKIREGKIVFNDHKFVITGEFTFAVLDGEQFVIIINNGKINNNQLPKNTPIKFNNDNYIFESHYPAPPRLPKSFYQLSKEFAEETEYQRETDGRAKRIYNNERSSRKLITKPTFLKLHFANGVTALYNAADRKCRWSRPNGDFVDFVFIPESSNEFEISNYKITAGKYVITPEAATYTFENGNKYTGTINEPSLNNETGKIGLEQLAYFRGFAWKWSDFKNKALNGVVVYPDGRSEKVVNGITESETARIEAERKAAEEAKKRAEAARIAAEQEAKRKAEAARIAAEQEAKKKAEAARIAAEQEAKRKAEEEARIAAEQEAKRKTEEEARIAAEQEAKIRAEEEARIAAEQEAKRRAEEEARIAAEQEAKRRAEEEARIAAEQEAKRRAEEEARIAAEQEAKRRAEEEERRIAEYKAKREAENARMAAEYEARRRAEANTPGAPDIASVAAQKEAQMRAEINRLASERANIAAEQEAKRRAEEARVATEAARSAAEKIHMRIIAAFEFITLKKHHTDIVEDNQVARLFYHPTYNPYSDDFRMLLGSRMANFCPCIGYEIVSITGNRVICNLKKRDENGSMSTYQLAIEHNNGLLNITSFDITKARRIQ
ncbi:MAG: hypothetical protein IKA70_06305 [Alistipes sp.]|nr:hypothetical protein [Alistipes sp.]